MKKVSDEEFAATIEEIKARYGVIAKTDQETEINWDALFVRFFFLFLPLFF